MPLLLRLLKEKGNNKSKSNAQADGISQHDRWHQSPQQVALAMHMLSNLV
jgi:hypothetical protein